MVDRSRIHQSPPLPTPDGADTADVADVDRASVREPDEVVPLSALHPGERGVVVQLAGGRGLLCRMASLGFTPGAEVTVAQNFGRGPLIAVVRDARIALGRGEAGRLYVRRRSR
jgi:ferrous iron transport protein A